MKVQSLTPLLITKQLPTARDQSSITKMNFEFRPLRAEAIAEVVNAETFWVQTLSWKSYSS